MSIPSRQYFWQIESIWEKKFSPKKPFYNWEYLIEKYSPLKKNSTIFQSNPNFKLSKKKIFEDENNILYPGLKNFSISIRNKKPIYVIDNHQNALIPFFDFYTQQNKKITVVHIDAHRDDAIVKYEIKTKKLITQEDINALLKKCRVSDYLDAGKKIGIIEEVISITQSKEFETFSIPKHPYILNLDIDIYGPEGTAVSTQLKTEVIAKAWNNAEVICFATSPGFISHEIAEKIGNIFIPPISE